MVLSPLRRVLMESWKSRVENYEEDGLEREAEDHPLLPLSSIPKRLEATRKTRKEKSPIHRPSLCPSLSSLFPGLSQGTKQHKTSYRNGKKTETSFKTKLTRRTKEPRQSRGQINSTYVVRMDMSETQNDSRYVLPKWPWYYEYPVTLTIYVYHVVPRLSSVRITCEEETKTRYVLAE